YEGSKFSKHGNSLLRHRKPAIAIVGTRPFARRHWPHFGSGYNRKAHTCPSEFDRRIPETALGAKQIVDAISPCECRHRTGVEEKRASCDWRGITGLYATGRLPSIERLPEWFPSQALCPPT